MVVTEVNGDIALSGAGHRCVQLGFLEHRCLRGVRTSHSAPSFDGCRTRVSTSSRWTGLVLKSGLHALDNSCTPFGQFGRAAVVRRTLATSESSAMSAEADHRERTSLGSTAVAPMADR